MNINLLYRFCTDGEERISGPDPCVAVSKRHVNSEEQDAEVVRKAREEGCVSVVFPGTVTQDGCYRFVCEILKCILYQRQQLPMTYDQLVYSQKKQQASVQVGGKLTRRLFHLKPLISKKRYIFIFLPFRKEMQ